MKSYFTQKGENGLRGVGLLDAAAVDTEAVDARGVGVAVVGVDVHTERVCAHLCGHRRLWFTRDDVMRLVLANHTGCQHHPAHRVPLSPTRALTHPRSHNPRPRPPSLSPTLALSPSARSPARSQTEIAATVWMWLFAVAETS